MSSIKDETSTQNSTTDPLNVKDWKEEQVSQWLQEHNLSKFVGRIKNGRVLCQLHRDENYLEKLSKWDDEMEKINDILQFKFELNDLMSNYNTAVESSKSLEEDKSRLLPSVASSISFPTAHSSPKTKRAPWRLWAKIDHDDPVRILNVNPADSIQKLKLQIKKHPELSLSMLPLRDFSLKNSSGETLPQDQIIGNCLDEDDAVQVVLLAPDSVERTSRSAEIKEEVLSAEDYNPEPPVERPSKDEKIEESPSLEEAHAHNNNNNSNGGNSERRASTETILEDMREALFSSGENAILSDDRAEKSHDAITIEPNFDTSLVIPEGKQPVDLHEWNNENPEFIVGIGTSAGGLESLQQFFDNMPEDSGLAFVVVQHLSPMYKSMMVELLAKHTQMKVMLADNGLQVKANSVYVIPPSVNIFIIQGKLYLKQQDRKLGFAFPINTFFRSLAVYKRERSIGIIFSGTGSDGQEGVREIKEAGGIVMVQDSSAKFDGMPRSAINTGLVDFILSPEEMAAQLVQYITHYTSTPKLQTESNMNDDIITTFNLLKRATGVDFQKYKPATVLRRVEHRMNLKRFTLLSEYVKYLQTDPQEVDDLFRDLLIRVTSFFRDREAWDILEHTVLAKILDNLTPGEPIRIWVVGASTGEEPYSIAMTLLDMMDKSHRNFPIKIYATDVDKGAVEIAANGIYDENIAASVPPDRLSRFFVRKGNTFHVSRRLRECVIFAVHNIITDPPFHRISLISCRNLLIYFKPLLQLKVLSLFHFSLKEGGYLFLGCSENINSKINVFTTVNSKWRIYQSKLVKKTIPTENLKLPPSILPNAKKQLQRNTVVLDSVYNVWQKEYVPPCVIVDGNGKLLHTFGEVSPFFQFSGEASLNVIEIARKDLGIPLSIAMRRVLKENTTVYFTNIHLKGKSTKGKDDVTTVDIKVVPLFEVEERTMMIFLQISKKLPNPPLSDRVITTSTTGKDKDVNDMYLTRINDLENELIQSQENLQSTIEELETSNEELQSTNEELLASNEELQSTNEELQSVNEELYTVNSEFSSKIEELTELNNDLYNLLTSTHIGTIFLDNKLRIRKFTQAVTKHVPVLESDIGRPISHLANHTFHKIEEDAKKVMETLQPTEREICSENKWYLMRTLPYQSELLNSTNGVVITFFDITNLKKIEEQLRGAKEEAEAAAKVKAEFLGNMSHEIRTPMNGICGFAELLLTSKDLNDDHREYIQYINKSATMMISLLDDILDITQIEAGKLTLVTKPFSILNTVYRVVDMLALLSIQKKIDLICFASPNCPMEVVGDDLRLQQILVNLTSNALKFTEKGWIKVSLRYDGPSEHNPRLGNFFLSVEDTGAGIPDAKKDLIFEKFTQLDSSLSRKTGGIGLGLAISKDLVERMGGQLKVESMIGKGSVFYFSLCLPIATPPAPPLKRKYHVLYLEKPGEHAKALTEMLSLLDINVVRATNEDEAIAACSKEISIAMVAIGSCRNVKETVKEIKKWCAPDLSLYALVPVNQLLESKTICDEIGANATLTKPVRVDRLVKYITGQVKEALDIASEVKFRDLRVLITEDNPVNQKIAERMFSSLGCKVELASNGAEAIDMAKSRTYDVIFMDLHMPEMDGFEATRGIISMKQARGETPIPVVALTAKVMPEDRDACLSAGMTDYLSKPISRQKLMDFLSRMFPEKIDHKRNN